MPAGSYALIKLVFFFTSADVKWETQAKEYQGTPLRAPNGTNYNMTFHIPKYTFGGSKWHIMNYELSTYQSTTSLAPDGTAFNMKTPRSKEHPRRLSMTQNTMILLHASTPSLAVTGTKWHINILYTAVHPKKLLTQCSHANSTYPYSLASAALLYTHP